ncbi:hypothetical protein, partial [Pseudomonas syringae group genomosp. 3]|uniref:hypothetical protein n=1 Tax=Pseudomonas syringae group genomosp. 3 TaxID=251701 RepID=UPI001E5FE55A
VGEGHLFHLGSTLHFSGLAYFSRFGSLFQSFLKTQKITTIRKVSQPNRFGASRSKGALGR